MIGFIGAMDIEIDGLAALLEDKKEIHTAGITYHKGKLNGRDVVAAVCGVGKVNSSVCVAVMISVFHPDCIINLGVAGGLMGAKGMKIGDIVVADSVVQHDFDLSAVGYKRGVLSGKTEPALPCDADLSTRLYEAAIRSAIDVNVWRGVIASGDQFIADNDVSAKIRDDFGAAAVEMEGGSIGQACEVLSTPFCVLRSISDTAENEANVSFEEFCKTAAERAIAIAVEFVGASA